MSIEEWIVIKGIKMEFVNFIVALPVADFLQLEKEAKKLRTTKNELITFAINSQIINNSLSFSLEKNAENKTFYNKF